MTDLQRQLQAGEERSKNLEEDKGKLVGLQCGQSIYNMEPIVFVYIYVFRGRQKSMVFMKHQN